MKYKNVNDYELLSMIEEKNDFCYDAIFNKYRSLINKYASLYYNKYCYFGYDYDDFLQEGYIGFSKALNYYNDDKNVLFYSFACLCIDRHFISFIRCISKKYENLIYLTENNIDYLYNLSYKSNFDYDIISLYNDYLFSLSIIDSSIFELKNNLFSYIEISKLLDIDVNKVRYIYRKLKYRFIDYYKNCIEKGI